MLKPYTKSVPFTVTRVLSIGKTSGSRSTQCLTQQKLNAAAGTTQSQTFGPSWLTSLPLFIRGSSPKSQAPAF